MSKLSFIQNNIHFNFYFCEAESFSIPHPSSTDIYLYITSSPEARKLKELLANEASDGARCLRYLHPSMRSFTL